MNLSKQNWQKSVMPITASIEQVIFNLNLVGIKIVLITNVSGVLEGTVSDGDIRRGLMKGFSLDSSVENILHRQALVVTSDIGIDAVRRLMLANKIQQIPVVNEKNVVIGLHLWDNVDSTEDRLNLMVIMAGGAGKRLRPLTETCPKPMLEISGKPMIEHIIERAKAEGFNHFVIAIHYLGEMIEGYLGNGERLGVKIEYLRENTPLGTAGALSLFNKKIDLPFVVSNGDVMTDIRYGEILDFHVRNSSVATMAVRAHEWQHPFGVVQTDGIKIVGFEEKPIMRSHINAGVYVLAPSSLKVLEVGQYCDMPTLFSRLQKSNLLTIAYPMHEPWLDVGRPSDLHKANNS